MCLHGLPCTAVRPLQIQHFNKLMFLQSFKNTGLLKCCGHILLVAFEILIVLLFPPYFLAFWRNADFELSVCIPPFFFPIKLIRNRCKSGSML